MEGGGPSPPQRHISIDRRGGEDSGSSHTFRPPDQARRGTRRFADGLRGGADILSRLTSDASSPPVLPAAPSSAPRAELFAVSVLVLFLELACIRWFPAHVLYLTFFTNTVLLASFLGLSLGCLTARDPRDHLRWTPLVLVLALAAGAAMETIRVRLGQHLDVGHQAAPQVVFFGTERFAKDPTKFPIPIEVVAGSFFVAIALVMIGPGQALGRSLARFPDRVEAYTINIAGSVAGVAAFTLASWARLSPLWWFGAVALLLGPLTLRSPGTRGRWRVTTGVALVLIVALPALTTRHWAGKGASRESYWSPYYRIDYRGAPRRIIGVNLIGHQQMLGLDTPALAYALPHLFRRDSGGAPFRDVLVIGAGSGNDVSRALAFGAEHVDAVEIDPLIQRLGVRDHPDHPYQDPRVEVHIDDGRNFLRTTSRSYDLIVYALVDSLVLHSGYSNIRLESYLFTREALADVQRHLRPGGWFTMYNFYRQGWIVERLRDSAREVFGTEPLVFPVPFQPTIDAEKSYEDFTMVVAGGDGSLAALERTFRAHPRFWLPDAAPPLPSTPNGFLARPESAGADSNGWQGFAPANIASSGPPGVATDDWPFLYLRQRLIPTLTWRGVSTMAVGAVLLFAIFGRRSLSGGAGFSDAAMLALGAGFMLVETKAVVQMALLLGSTWLVNSVVFLGILLVILAANLFVLRARPARFAPFFVGLAMSLGVGWVTPIHVFLGAGRALQVAVATLLLVAPVFFAGVVFAMSLDRCRYPDRALGWNVAGAMLGGWLENLSMAVGFGALSGVALAIYAVAAAFTFTASSSAGTTSPSPPPSRS